MALRLSSGMACELSVTSCLALLKARDSKTRLILDKRDRIIAVMVGRPDDPQWGCVIDAAAEVLRDVERCGADMELFTGESRHHRRGVFLAIPAGVSFGGGQTVRPQPNISGSY